MKDNIKLITLILLMISIPLATSLLLDWSFIKVQASRVILIYVLMLIEFLVMLVIIMEYLKTISRN